MSGGVNSRACPVGVGAGSLALRSVSICGAEEAAAVFWLRVLAPFKAPSPPAPAMTAKAPIDKNGTPNIIRAAPATAVAIKEYLIALEVKVLYFPAEVRSGYPSVVYPTRAVRASTTRSNCGCRQSQSCTGPSAGWLARVRSKGRGQGEDRPANPAFLSLGVPNRQVTAAVAELQHAMESMCSVFCHGRKWARLLHMRLTVFIFCASQSMRSLTESLCGSNVGELHVRPHNRNRGVWLPT